MEKRNITYLRLHRLRSSVDHLLRGEIFLIRHVLFSKFEKSQNYFKHNILVTFDEPRDSKGILYMSSEFNNFLDIFFNNLFNIPLPFIVDYTE